MGEALLPVGTSYAEVYARFRWQLPTTFNIGVDVCDRHADDPSGLAMIYEDDNGQVACHTFAENTGWLQSASARAKQARYHTWRSCRYYPVTAS